MSLDKDILNDFILESKKLVEDSLEILNEVEGQPDQAKRLADYGNLVDRIMGGARSLALLVPKDHAIHMVSDYAAVCKAVGYKSSQILENDSFFSACVGLLLDATETLEKLLDGVETPTVELKKSIPGTFIDRLQWVSKRFSKDFRSSVSAVTDPSGAMSQDDIDGLLKKLGIG
ncbi:MAG TPA: hypothetical protein PLJ21_13660, partial [Pseudobdellovibrionaceae bacterium]|nr:hypothetical protein [Pseudobdellovibrionaceae bacterium]